MLEDFSDKKQVMKMVTLYRLFKRGKYQQQSISQCIVYKQNNGQLHKKRPPRDQTLATVASFRCAIGCDEIEGFIYLCAGAW